MLTRISKNKIETAKERRAVKAFMETAKHSGPFNTEPLTLDDNPHCGVWTKKGEDIPALAIFEDDLGNWSLLRKDNRMVQQFFADEII